MYITDSHFSFESSASDFTGAISPGASAYADLTVGGGNAGPLKAFITTVEVIAKQDIDMRVEFYKKTLTKVVNTASYFPSNLIGWVNLVGSGDNLPANWTGAGVATATTFGTMFAWFLGGLSIPYEDRDPGNGELHVNVVNQSGTAKDAGTAGYLFLRGGTVNSG